MKINIGASELAEAIFNKGESGMTYEACRAIAEHYNELEDSSGEELTVCPVAIRCDWMDYSDPIQWAQECTGRDDITIEYAEELLGEHDGAVLRLASGGIAVCN